MDDCDATPQVSSAPAFDHALGDVDLIAACNSIEDPILAEGDRRLGFEEESAKHAGYLLGIEIGRWLGGVR